MSADLCIHIFEGIAEEDLAEFNSHTFGSKYFDLSKKSFSNEVFDKILGTERIDVGEVSWLKAAVTDSDEFVPGPIGKLVDIIGEDLPVIDDELIAKIGEAMKVPNKSGYSIKSEHDVVTWLQARKGKRIFTVSW
jgi:hypothetical protein